MGILAPSVFFVNAFGTTLANRRFVVFNSEQQIILVCFSPNDPSISLMTGWKSHAHAFNYCCGLTFEFNRTVYAITLILIFTFKRLIAACRKS